METVECTEKEVKNIPKPRKKRNGGNPIRKHLKKFVRCIENFDLFFETVMKNGVFDEYIAYDILKEETDRDRKMSMYEEVANGGPGCLAKLCSCFIEIRMSHLVKYLDPNFSFLTKSAEVEGSKDSETILKNLDLLVKGTDDTYLVLQKLISKRLFDAKIRNLIESENENEKKIKLYILVDNCGEVAIIKLRECFRQLGLDSLEQLLSEYPKGICATDKKGITERAIATTNFLKDYKMGSSPKGFVLLINTVYGIGKDERKGMNLDVGNISSLWKNMGYEVIFKTGLSKMEFEYEVKAFSYMCELSDIDSGIIFIMSHGRSPEDVHGFYSEDKHQVRYQWVLEQFTNTRCPQLSGKPKIFVFYSCGGSERSQPRSFTSSTRISPELTDAIIVRCFTSGCRSSIYADCYGSCLMEAICEVFERHSRNEHFETLLKYVDQYLKLQYEEQWNAHCLSIENRGFNRQLYFEFGK